MNSPGLKKKIEEMLARSRAGRSGPQFNHSICEKGEKGCQVLFVLFGKFSVSTFGFIINFKKLLMAGTRFGIDESCSSYPIGPWKFFRGVQKPFS